MALTHYAYSFNVDGFLTLASPLVESIDKGDLRPLYETVLDTIRSSSQESWLLAESGSRLPAEQEFMHVNFVGLPRSRPMEDYLSSSIGLPSEEIGYWFLIVLSRYLIKPCGIGSDYSVLDAALGNAGWSDRDRDRLTTGLPCCRLIRSDCTRLSLRTDSDPYWHWIVPSHAQSSGWLPHSEVIRLAELLAQTEPAIRDYDVGLFPNPWGLTGEYLADSQADWNHHLQGAFDRAVTMLENVQRTESGVFMVMAY